MFSCNVIVASEWVNYLIEVFSGRRFRIERHLSIDRNLDQTHLVRYIFYGSRNEKQTLLLCLFYFLLDFFGKKWFFHAWTMHGSCIAMHRKIVIAGPCMGLHGISARFTTQKKTLNPEFSSSIHFRSPEKRDSVII